MLDERETTIESVIVTRFEMRRNREKSKLALKKQSNRVVQSKLVRVTVVDFVKGVKQEYPLAATEVYGWSAVGVSTSRTEICRTGSLQK